MTGRANSGDHDENLDAELAQIQADADVRIAAAKGRTQAGGGKAAGPQAPEEETSHRSWDEFWAETERAEADERGDAATETIRGVEVVVPHDLPLRFQRRLDDVQTQERTARADAAEREARAAELRAAEARGDDVTADLEELNAPADDPAGDEALANTKALLVDLFGRDVFDQWVDGGMTEKEFQVVLLWGMAHGKGQPMTFREAYTAFRRAEGKAPAPASASAGATDSNSSRPSAKRKPRAATGGRSKATSTASTGSGPATSRA